VLPDRLLTGAAERPATPATGPSAADPAP